MTRWSFGKFAGLMVFLSALSGFSPATVLADTVPTHYGLGANFGLSYDPDNDIDFLQLNGFVLLDYDRVWPHRAPESLRFKVEGSAGVTTAPRTRAVVSTGMLALHYLDCLAVGGLRPYAEAGIGLIYTDFQVPGQGWRINFNPQAGIGTELKLGAFRRGFIAVRAHHLSNGRLYRENRGVNSVALQAGLYFD